jgi:hypothetical protein
LQNAPLEHVAVQALGPQVKPASPSGLQNSPLGQSTPQPVGVQVPSTHSSPVPHVTVAQLPTQRGAEKSVFGLQTSPAAQVFGSHGSSTQTPPLQA